MEKEIKATVHHVLSYSYSVFWLGLILGMLVDLAYPIRIIPKAITEPIGLALMILAPLLIFWAQSTSYKLSLKKEKLTKEDFGRGPYKLTGSPTHLGLMFLSLGFGVLINSIFVIIFTIISYFVSRHSFVKEEEKMLSERYGEEYLNYKKSVNTWL